MLGVNGWEVVLLALIAVFVLGPDRLPEYAAKLARGIRQLRVMAEGAKGQLKDQLGPEYEDINWRQYDPRQYDPRRIVKEALLDPLDEAIAPIRDEIGSVRSAASRDGVPGVGAEVASGAAAAVGAAAVASTAGSGDSEDAVPGAVRHVQQHSSDPRPPRDPRVWDPVRPIPFDGDAT
ncbi:MAG: twin-arginine translocase TatA/TatE family subunit [Ornithinibacter sp.]